MFNILCDLSENEYQLRLKRLGKYSDRFFKTNLNIKKLYLNAVETYPNFKIIDTGIYTEEQAYKVLIEIISPFVDDIKNNK